MVKLISLVAIAALAATPPAFSREHHVATQPASITLAAATAGYVVVEPAGFEPPTPAQVQALLKKQQSVIASCRDGLSWEDFLDCVSSKAATTDFGPGVVVYTLAKKPPVPVDPE